MDRQEVLARILNGLFRVVGFVWVVFGIVGGLIALVGGDFVGAGLAAGVLIAGFGIIEYMPRFTRRFMAFSANAWGKSDRPPK